MTSEQQTRATPSLACPLAWSSMATEELTNLAKDAFFVSVGFGVLAFQRSQVRRRELTDALAGGTGSSLGRIEDVVRVLEQAVAATGREVRRLMAPDAA